MSVFLLPNIRWCAIKRLETEAKWSWIVVLPIRQLQESKHPRQLMENVIINILAVVLLNVLCSTIIRSKKAIPQSRHIVELLDHGVHVTNCSQVSDSTVAHSVSSILCRCKIGPLWFVNCKNLPPPVVFQDFIGQMFNLVGSTYGQQQIVSCLNTRCCMTFVYLFSFNWLKIDVLSDVRIYWLEV